MRMILVTAALLGCMFGHAAAEEAAAKKTAQSVYQLTDMVDSKKSRVEAWEISLHSRLVHWDGNESVGPYTIRKEAFGRRNAQKVTSDGQWRDEVRTEGQPTYLVERYVAHPALYGEEGTGFGYFEIRDTETDRTIVNWPVFFTIQELPGNMYRFRLRGYLPDGATLIIVRDYLEDEYFAPLLESQSMLRGEEVLSHFTLSRMQ